MKISFKTVITCPDCGFVSEELMDVTESVSCYHCRQCDSLIVTPAGECCVYCSFGDTPCPSSQLRLSTVSNNPTKQ
ncbi:GDCCVxC domain-containing (seleno)protein [Veronia pacifica]